MTRTVKILIIINAAAFLLMRIFDGFGWFIFFGLVPRLVFSKFMVWQLATYMFLHADFLHILFNMLMLWFFAPAIERAWGRKQFLFYYFFTGIAAGLCSFIVSPGSAVPVIGASGAIYGILVAYAVMFPETIVLLFFLFPVKIKYAIWIFAAVNLYGALSSLGTLSFSGGGIAYFAHLGGGLFGYLYLKHEWIRMKLIGPKFGRIRFWQQAGSKRRRNPQENLNQQVDRILEKISKYGMDSLTEREKRVLKHKSKGGSIR
ncbi:MAG: rhomboid family intramembrane serine protease [Candidatus Omnitrophota bacterium]|nr:MAG: rhomboid family intramembrane serine protease [Candidatus Omnitrophota bacterium]